MRRTFEIVTVQTDLPLPADVLSLPLDLGPEVLVADVLRLDARTLQLLTVRLR